MTTPIHKQGKLLGFGTDGERKESVAFTNEMQFTETQGGPTERAESAESLATKEMLIIEDKENQL